MRDHGSHSISASFTYGGGHFSAEEVLAGGLVVFSTTCGVVAETRLLCNRARYLLRQRGAKSFLEVDLASEPAELPTLHLLLASNGVKKERREASAQHLPVVFLNGTLLAGGGKPSLQELEDEGKLLVELRRELAPRPMAERRHLPELKDLPPHRVMHQGWLLKEAGVLRSLWQRRWAVLTVEGIFFFKSQTDASGRSCGLIPLGGATFQTTRIDFHFEITTPRRTYLLRVDRPNALPAVDGGRSRENSFFGLMQVRDHGLHSISASFT